MKAAMIIDMCILSHQNTVFFDLRRRRRRRRGQAEGFARTTITVDHRLSLTLSVYVNIWYIYIYIYIYIHIYMIHIHDTYTYVYVYIYIHIHTYVYIYIYTYILGSVPVLRRTARAACGKPRESGGPWGCSSMIYHGDFPPSCEMTAGYPFLEDVVWDT